MDLPLNVDFTGKVVVITGAGGVICSTMARAFAQAGAKVAAINRTGIKVEKLAEELRAEGFICNGYEGNVLDEEGMKKIHEQILADFGPCDILINGAGGNNPRATTDNEYQHEAKPGQKTFFDLDMEGVNDLFSLNFQGTLLPTQIFAKDMVERKSGCILNISSMNAYIPLQDSFRKQYCSDLLPVFLNLPSCLSYQSDWITPPLPELLLLFAASLSSVLRRKQSEK